MNNMRKISNTSNSAVRDRFKREAQTRGIDVSFRSIPRHGFCVLSGVDQQLYPRLSVVSGPAVFFAPVPVRVFALAAFGVNFLLCHPFESRLNCREQSCPLHANRIFT